MDLKLYGEKIDYLEIYKGHAAINVKYRGPWPKLSPSLEAQLLLLSREARQAVEDQAHQDTLDNWWEWAAELAQECGVGKIYSEGRSGGWLVFGGYHRAHIEDLVTEAEAHCKHCGLLYPEHFEENKCPFEATAFEPLAEGTDEEGVERARGVLFSFKQFYTQVQESLEHVAGDYVANLEYALEWRRDNGDNAVEAAPGTEESGASSAGTQEEAGEETEARPYV